MKAFALDSRARLEGKAAAARGPGSLCASLQKGLLWVPRGDLRSLSLWGAVAGVAEVAMRPVASSEADVGPKPLLRPQAGPK